MRNKENAYQSWLWGEVLLFGLLGATLALFVAYPNLRPTFDLPQVRLVLDTTVALAAVLVAVLAGIRFSVDGRRLDLLLCAGFSLAAGSTFCFAVAPVLGGHAPHRRETWALLWGRVLAAVLIAAAAFARRRTAARRRELFELLVLIPGLLFALWSLADSAGVALPTLAVRNHDQPPLLLTSMLAVCALASLLAVIGFGLRFRARGNDLDRWLALRGLDARDDARERCRPRDDDSAAQAGRHRSTAGGPLRDPRAVVSKRNGSVRRGAAPLRRLPDRGRGARGRPRDRRGRAARPRRADRGLSDRPGGPSERAQARRRTPRRRADPPPRRGACRQHRRRRDWVRRGNRRERSGSAEHESPDREHRRRLSAALRAGPRDSARSRAASLETRTGDPAKTLRGADVHLPGVVLVEGAAVRADPRRVAKHRVDVERRWVVAEERA